MDGRGSFPGSDVSLRGQPPSQWLQETFPKVKRLDSEADHSLATGDAQTQVQLHLFTVGSSNVCSIMYVHTFLLKKLIKG